MVEYSVTYKRLSRGVTMGYSPPRHCIYLAGPMGTPAKARHEVADWRRSFIKAAEVAPIGIDFLCPEWVGCDHGGIAPEQTVRGDLAMIDGATGLFALLDDRLRVGTFTEIGYALGRNIPVVVMVNHAAHADGVGTVKHGQVGFYEDITQSGHQCDCSLGGYEGYFWFPMAGVNAWAIYDKPGEAINLGLRLLVKTLMGIKGS